MDSSSLEDLLRTAVTDVTVGDDTRLYQIDEITPHFVAHPSDISELSNTVAMAYQNDLVIAPLGGKTRREVGNTISGLDMVVDLTNLDHIIEHNPADLTATIQCGATVNQVQNTLKKHGQFLAIDPPLPARATIGGTLATGLSGPLKWQYGSPRDTVIGMKIVQSDGTVTKTGGQVVKNVSGYDMARLHVGSIGTLGIIAEASFKLTPLPTQESTLLSTFSSQKQSVQAGLTVYRNNAIPLAISTFDANADNNIQYGEKEGASFLAIRLGGRKLSLSRQIKDCRNICVKLGAQKVDVLELDDESKLWKSLSDFGWSETKASIVVCRAQLKPSMVSEFTALISKINQSNNLHLSIVTHPAHGIALVRWTTSEVMTPDDPTPEFLRFLQKETQLMGGQLLIERCPPTIKPSLDVWDNHISSLRIMRQLKNQYDPKNILNRGRFAGGI